MAELTIETQLVRAVPRSSMLWECKQCSEATAGVVQNGQEKVGRLAS
jgi:hypothetical protein